MDFAYQRIGIGGSHRKIIARRACPFLAVLVAPYVRPASAEDRGEVEKLARTVQAVIGDSVEIAWVDQGLPVLTEPLEHGADVFLMLVFDRTTRAIDDHLQEAIVLGLA